MGTLLRDRTVPAPSLEPSFGYAVPLAALILGALAMGLSPVFVRLAAPEVGPLASAFWRAILALPLLYVWARAEGGVGRAAASRPALLAGAAFAGDLAFWHAAIWGTTVANATFLATMAPVVVIGIALATGRRVGAPTLWGLAICLVGGAALVGHSLAFAPDRLMGDLSGLATAIFFALYLLSVAQARAAGIGPGALSFASAAVTGALLLPLALLGDAGSVWPKTGGAWAALAALAIVSQVGGQGLLAVALGRLPAVFSSLVIFLEAVFAAAAGWIVLGEALAAVQAAGGALIVLGIWVARPRAEGHP